MKKSIIVAEDDLFTLKQYEKLLGFNHVEYVTNGSDLLKKINSNEYDLIISDNRMPGMYGVEVLSEIRDVENKTPFHLTSNLGVDNWERLGASSFMNKYDTLKNLDAILSRYTDFTIETIKNK